MQMLLLLLLLINHFHVPLISSFNIDVDTSLIHRGPPGTYFGFSVTQHKDGRASWLLVGAPLAQTDQPRVERGGAVYKCSADSSNACQQLPFDPTGHDKVLIQGREEQVDNKSYQWFGATVVSSGKTGMILACAPRYVYFSSNRKRREPVGTCFLSRGSFTGFLEYSPCRTPSSWGYHRQGSCQAGFSAALSTDGKRAFIGAPGSWYWQGQVFSQDLVLTPNLPQEPQTPLGTKDSPEQYDDTYLGYSMAIGAFSSSKLPHDIAVGMPKGLNLTGQVVLYSPNLVNLCNISGEQLGSYFGHSIAAADVNGDGLDDLIIGAPLFTSPNTKEPKYEEGRVYVAYQDSKHQFNIRTRIDGKSSRGRFGAAIAAVGDLNKDGYADIAVGAPYGGSPHANGAVYIFNGGKNGLDPEASQVIYAEDLREPALSTFGFALSGGLDLDGNEYPDLLVGAYGSDQVIHLRARPVVNVSATLKVEPENVNLEDKQCTLSDNTTVPCVIISMCMQYTGLGVPWELNFTLDIKLDTGTNRSPRAFLLYNEGRTEDKLAVPLKKDTRFCRSVYAYLSSGLRDKLTPIKVDLEFDLHHTYFGPRILRPVLNKANSNKLSRLVHIEKNCGKDNKCIPDLRLAVRPNMDQYLIGSRTRLELDITVKNGGEDAFESMLYLFMPLGVNYVSLNRSKSDDAVICTGAQPEKTGMNVLICDIGNPLPANRRVNFAVLLEPSSMLTAAPDYTFIVSANSSNPEEGKNVEDNEVVIGLPIRVEVNMTVTGISIPEPLIYNFTEPIIAAKSNELDIGPQVTHMFQVQNRGPSTIRQAMITILWPSTTPDGQYLLYLLDQPVITGRGQCQTITLDELNPLRLPLAKEQDIPPINHTIVLRHIRRPDLEAYDATLSEYISCGPRPCTKIYCSVSDLAKGDTVLFSVRSRLWKETVVDIAIPQFVISSKMVAIVSRLPYDVDPGYLEPQVSIVTTSVHVIGLERPRPVPLWVILLGVLGGLLLLAVLTLAFYRCGFFKRRRPPIVSTDSEPLNGYHYAKGDTDL